MKIGVKIGFALALLWIIIKMIFFYANMSLHTYEASALINNFFLLCTISITLYLFLKKNNYAPTPFLTDVKQAVVGGFVYTIVVSLFSWFYYANIDTTYIDNKIELRMEAVKKALQTDKQLAEFKKSQPAMEMMTREEIYANIRKSATSTLSPKVAAIIMLLGFTMLTFLYSVVVTFFFRKILLRGVR